MIKFTVIGISDRSGIDFSSDLYRGVSAKIADSKIFSGGKRHYTIVKHLLPLDHIWIDIVVPLASVFDRYREYDNIVVFASGDPLFFGFANTIKRELPDADIDLYPFFNSLQMLAHRSLLPYHDMIYVSQTGRPWDLFDSALIKGDKKIGVLTDLNKTPSVIAKRMIKYGYDNYKMIVGENMGGEGERVREFDSLNEVIDTAFDRLNCLIIIQNSARKRSLGIPDNQFNILEGRPKMITKMPIRLISLSMLDLDQRSHLWDVGFCTGSISIESKLQYPLLKVTSFEQREEGRELMESNCIKFGTPGIDYHIGDFFKQDLSNIEKPDAIFIGGHGGRLIEMIKILSQHLKPEGVIVFNSVSEKTKADFIEGITSVDMQILDCKYVTLDSNNPIYIMKASR